MNPIEFAREIERANRRIVELRRARGEATTAWVEAALAELSSALEELKVAEEELSCQNEELAEAHAAAEFERFRYRELFVNAPFAQLVTDLKGTISEANRAAGDLFGTPSANLAGKPLPLMVSLGDRERFVRWVAVLKDASHDAIVCAECGGSGEFAIQTVDRSRLHPCEIIAAPLADRLGRISAIRWCVLNNTDRERARNVQRLMDEVGRKDELLAVLGHELRTPLSAVTLAAEILTAHESEPLRRRWAAEVIERHADHLKRLVGDLTDGARISRSTIALQREPVDLRAVLSAAVDSCQPILEGKGHNLVVAVPPEPVVVDGDSARLRQLLWNLLNNAARYTPSGGKVEIELVRDGQRAAITVRDSGIGIPRQELAQTVVALDQDHEDGEQRDRGLGPGLALVRQLSHLHGGAVRAASEGEGMGSSFTVELPLQAGGDGARAEPAGPTRQTGASRDDSRVLIVDDNVDATELLAEKLRRLGYAVDIAFDGQGGLAAARRAPFQVVLVDLGLPDLDGFEVCRALKGERPELRVVALTGFSDSRSRDRAKDAGFDRFLVKPLDPRRVIEALEELVGSRA